jgi:hypothetical protein
VWNFLVWRFDSALFDYNNLIDAAERMDQFSAEIPSQGPSQNITHQQ